MADRSTDSTGFRGPVTSPYTYYPQLTTKSGNCVQYMMLNQKTGGECGGYICNSSTWKNEAGDHQNQATQAA